MTEQPSTTQNYNVIRFDNRLVYQSSYYLPTRALKLLCHVIAKYVDPLAKELPRELHIPLKELEAALKVNEGSTWKSLYTDIDNICRELTSNPIVFKSGVEIKGMRMKGYINWCSSAMPYRNEKGRVFIRFGFDDLMSQFLLGLVEYVRLYRPEINRLRRPHAIRLFQMLKGIRNRRRQYEKLTLEHDGHTYEQVSVERYGVEELKFLFGIKDMYPQFKHFNNQVVKRSVEEINKHTTIQVIKVENIRKGRSVESLDFYFTEEEPNVPLPTLTVADQEQLTNEPTAKELEQLTWAQKLAFQKLKTLGVYPGIAFYQLLPGIKGTTFKGFEDHFVALAIEHFQRWARNQKSDNESAAVFVSWWMKLKVFEPNSDVWVKILEEVERRKKAMQKNELKKYDNRLMAAEMTEGAFRAWYNRDDKED